MTEKNSENKLKKDIEDFVEKNGWHGFFGLLATISPEKVDQEDLKKYNEQLGSYEEYEKDYSSEQLTQMFEDRIIEDASIYAHEHISAVQDDLREQGIGRFTVLEQPKTKVLEPPKSFAPNPWEEAKVVAPGELNLQ